MFNRKRPCANCPFRIGQGSLFQLHPQRLEEIRHGPAFQCHKTIDYDNFDDDRLRQGETPQQCAGLMAVLYAENSPNQIMQVAERLGALNREQIDGTDAYASWNAVLNAHCHAIEPTTTDHAENKLKEA